MLRIEEICTNVDDDFRDHLLEMDDERLRALLADSSALRHLVPMGVSYKEAVIAIYAILDFRAQPPEDTVTEAPKKKRAPRKKKAMAPPDVSPAGETPALPDTPPDVSHAGETPTLTDCLERGRPARIQTEPHSEAQRPVFPPLKPRWRDQAILLVPVALAAAVLAFLLIRH
ncbi:hypothetical protein CU669_13080 [Paramagnetospirillum kuznetsovii]|uniref:Uncharacterized protein n=1 Tax=Paramagnetospirillum kuznetsovii TaxID=2053833 RepID=A0A364NWA3_9PROT|nr:hypothetical protein [Paramagnetospirillum kuznetsovii]RAU21364.1 hypothetical protein CU669_13080 [Paramagnetospirillum kuznetsovii]